MHKYRVVVSPNMFTLPAESTPALWSTRISNNSWFPVSIAKNTAVHCAYCTRKIKKYAIKGKRTLFQFIKNGYSLQEFFNQSPYFHCSNIHICSCLNNKVLSKDTMVLLDSIHLGSHPPLKVKWFTTYIYSLKMFWLTSSWTFTSTFLPGFCSLSFKWYHAHYCFNQVF